MSVADSHLEEEETMPVRHLPMPPVRMQRNVSSGSALVRRQDDAKHPVP